MRRAANELSKRNGCGVVIVDTAVPRKCGNGCRFIIYFMAATPECFSLGLPVQHNIDVIFCRKENTNAAAATAHTSNLSNLPRPPGVDSSLKTAVYAVCCSNTVPSEAGIPKAYSNVASNFKSTFEVAGETNTCSSSVPSLVPDTRGAEAAIFSCLSV